MLEVSTHVCLNKYLAIVLDEFMIWFSARIKKIKFYQLKYDIFRSFIVRFLQII